MITVNVKDYYNKSATNAIQAAIDDCFFQGGGRVVITSGDYHIGSIRIRSNITLLLQKNAHLIASRDHNDYKNAEPVSEDDKTDALWVRVSQIKNSDHINKPASRWNNAVIKAIDAENISIISEEGSYIDGRDCFDELGEEHYRGPHAINMHRCENIHFEGYEIRNSANWAHALFDCKRTSCHCRARRNTSYDLR